MRIVGARIDAFRLPLRGALPGGLRVRDGMILRLEDEHGCFGLGEASPAPWVGGESLGAARKALERVRSAVGERPPEEALGALGRALSPAAASALESALLDLAARRAGVPLAVLLGGEAVAVEVSALVGGERPDDLAQAGRERVAGGFRRLKVKVGGRPVADDLARLEALREATPPAVSIRLDANRAWTLAEARTALRGAAVLGVDLVEEPLRAPAPGDLARLRRESGVAIALDESVRGREDLRRAIDDGALDAVVLKAARLGGPRRVLDLARLAAGAGIRTVVTDSLETSVGGRLAVHLAAALPAPREAVGLGGAAILASDPASPAGWGRGPSAFPEGPGLGPEARAGSDGKAARG